MYHRKVKIKFNKELGLATNPSYIGGVIQVSWDTPITDSIAYAAARLYVERKLEKSTFLDDNRYTNSEGQLKVKEMTGGDDQWLYKFKLLGDKDSHLINDNFPIYPLDFIPYMFIGNSEMFGENEVGFDIHFRSLCNDCMYDSNAEMMLPGTMEYDQEYGTLKITYNPVDNKEFMPLVEHYTWKAFMLDLARNHYRLPDFKQAEACIYPCERKFK